MKRYSCLLSLGVKQVSELEADTIKLLKPHKGKSKNPRTVTDPMEYPCTCRMPTLTQGPFNSMELNFCPIRTKGFPLKFVSMFNFI